METCEYCDEPATTTREVYCPELGYTEVKVCENCGNAIDDGLLEPDPFDPY